MTSAEPARTTAYSSDIRWRVVWLKISSDLPVRSIARQLCIGVGTVHRILRKFESTGDVQPLHPPVRLHLRKLDDLHELYIIGLIAENPGLYLSEMCQKIFEATNVVVSGPTLCRVLHRNGFTRKKIVQIAKQRSSYFRGKFMAEALLYPRDYFVWVDETGSDRRDQIRKFGYALIGEEPVFRRFFYRGRRVSAIAAISSDGVMYHELIHSTVNGDIFWDFVRGSLIPNMQPFPNKNSILVMDNCSIHHVQSVKETVESAGILTLFLPPYSPDFNPIENVFGSVKKYLKSHDDIIQAANNFEDIFVSAFNAITSTQCNSWINNAGYNTVGILYVSTCAVA